jgi:hypothetical protein
MGLAGPALEAPVTGIRGGLSRVAALLPLPWLIHRRADGADAASAAGGGGGSLATQAQTTMSQLSASVGIGADQAATAIHKAVAVVAAVAVVGGGGYVASKGTTRGDLLLKSDQNTIPARADVGPAVPPALRPLPSAHRAARGPAALAGQAAGPTGPASANASPLLPTGPTGVPGPIDTFVVPDAGAAPAIPGDPAAGGQSPSGTTAPDGGPGIGNSIPAAGDTGPSTPSGGNGSTDGGGSGGSGGGGGNGAGNGGGNGGGGGSSGGGGDTGGSGGSGGSTGTPGDGGGVGAADPPPPACDLPKGLEKKDKIPPGWAKKCAIEAAETAP